MIYGIMQPYFLPYVGYFSLIEYADRFIFFDTPQYISHGWVNRNRVLKQDGGYTYITVPVKKAVRSAGIKEMRIDNSLRWKEKIYGQLTAYKRRAPRYNDTVEFLHHVLDAKEYDFLAQLNADSIISICHKIGIECVYDTFSAMNLEIDKVHAPDEWALNMVKALGGDTYVNSPGGKAFFDPAKYERAGIRLQFLQSNLKPYIQRIGHFEPALSIVDVMMFCREDEIRDMVKDYAFV